MDLSNASLSTGVAGTGTQVVVSGVMNMRWVSAEEWDRLQDEVQRLRQVSAENKASAEYASRLQALQDERVRLFQQLSALTESNDKLAKENEALKRDLAALQDDNTKLKTQVGTLQDDNTELKTQMGTLQDDNTKLKTQVGTLQDDHTKLKTQVGTLQDDNTKLKTQVGTLQDEVGTLRGEVGTQQTVLERLNAEYTSRVCLAEGGELVRVFLFHFFSTEPAVNKLFTAASGIVKGIKKGSLTTTVALTQLEALARSHSLPSSITGAVFFHMLELKNSRSASAHPVNAADPSEHAKLIKLCEGHLEEFEPALGRDKAGAVTAMVTILKSELGV
jgi:predicted nuclease with TOPRIM domain